MLLPLAVLLPVVLLPAAPASAVPQTPRQVTRDEYAQVSTGMTRARIERLFGAGSGCVYLKYELDDVLFIGRQYRNTAGTTVSIQYERPGDGGRNRATGKQWGLLESCFNDERSSVPSPAGERAMVGDRWNVKADATGARAHPKVGISAALSPA